MILREQRNSLFSYRNLDFIKGFEFEIERRIMQRNIVILLQIWKLEIIFILFGWVLVWFKNNRAVKNGLIIFKSLSVISIVIYQSNSHVLFGKRSKLLSIFNRKHYEKLRFNSWKKFSFTVPLYTFFLFLLHINQKSIDFSYKWNTYIICFWLLLYPYKEKKSERN